MLSMDGLVRYFPYGIGEKQIEEHIPKPSDSSLNFVQKTAHKRFASYLSTGKSDKCPFFRKSDVNQSPIVPEESCNKISPRTNKYVRISSI
ncbi:hypothetical protein PRIPAC_78434, partial [Pristionchus pacificus]|uniref:Uncharacterized protein n=1 Tax=Pristionchus pacificus TaxID=54126 RepID=A0A2A6CM66_PRIPA